LKIAGFDILNLANNHFGNQGRPGMLYTYDHLTANGIGYVGAGRNDTEAHGAKTLEVDGYKLAFLGYNDVEPVAYTAKPDTPGLAWATDDKVRAGVAAAAAASDFVVVNVHWGNEYTPDPTDRQRALARLMVDAGADVVIGHHPHVVQATEFYRGAFIAYSLGNFVFDQMWSVETQQGLIAELSLIPVTGGATDGVPARNLELIATDLTPVRIYNYNQPDFVDAAERNEILKRVFEASARL
jgi:poly-gamma-glutamate synthesis protein (capsule biosynthesis protein)